MLNPLFFIWKEKRSTQFIVGDPLNSDMTANFEHKMAFQVFARPL